MRDDPGSRADAGFTLLEVLVALVIAALATGALYQGSLGGLLAARVSGQTQEAVSRARSRLAEIGHGTLVRAGDQQGDDGGGYRWRVRVVPAATVPLSGDARGPLLGLYDVTVWISWRAGGMREVRLDSRVAAIAPPPAR